MISEEKGLPFDPRKQGRFMREWVCVEVKNSKLWIGLAEEARDYALGAKK